jgi:hypothetical protein
MKTTMIDIKIATESFDKTGLTKMRKEQINLKTLT